MSRGRFTSRGDSDGIKSKLEDVSQEDKQEVLIETVQILNELLGRLVLHMECVTGEIFTEEDIENECN